MLGCPGLDVGASRCSTGTFDHDRDPATPCIGMTRCAPGTYVRAGGSRTEDRVCAPCPAGTFSDRRNVASCSTCPQGAYCPSGSKARSKCPAGTWDDDGDPSTPCVDRGACPAGTEDATQGSPTSDVACAPCPPGEYDDGHRHCVVDPGCPAESVQVEAGTTTTPAQCAKCVSGEFCEGGTAPKVACGDGTWDHDLSAATACVPWTTCGPGVYVDPNGATATRDRCLPCPPGTYNDATMASACIAQSDCPPGTYVRAPGSSANDRVCAACQSSSTGTAANAATCGSVQSLAADGQHTCAIMSDGSVRCWGDGFGTSAVPVPGVATAVAVAVAVHHACALLADGTVACWGDGSWGRLGEGTTGIRQNALPVPGVSNVVSLAASEDATYALQADGSVLTWGTYHDRQGWTETVCDGDTGFGDCETHQLWGYPKTATTPVTLDLLAGVSQLYSNGGVVCGTTAQRVRCADPWRLDAADHELGSVTALGTVEAAAADGQVWRWFDWTTTLHPLDLTGVTALDEGAAHTCFITQHEVACMGSNASGQLGDGTTNDETWPVATSGLTDVVAVAAGTAHSCALKVDGSVWCWGANELGQVGDGTTVQRLTPSKVTGL